LPNDFFETDTPSPRLDRHEPLRVVAARIIDMNSDTERTTALDAITDSHARAIVRFYVDDYFARRDGTPLPSLFPPRPF
jgi:hypothetical protein